MADSLSSQMEHFRSSDVREVIVKAKTPIGQRTFCGECKESILTSLQHCPNCNSSLFRDINFENSDTENKPKELKCPEEQVEQKSTLERGRRNFYAKRLVCPEHRDFLKLYCETDQTLICLICRDGKDHKGHNFKPLKEVQEEIKARLVAALFHLQEDMGAVLKFQVGEQIIASRTKVRNSSLKTEISQRFEAMHELLNQKEQQAMKELEELNLDSEKQLEIIDNVLKEGRERQAVLKHGLDIDQPLDFLHWWIKNGLKEEKAVRVQDNYTTNELQSGPLMNKCPPATPERPWTQDHASAPTNQPNIELESLLGYLNLEGLGRCLSRIIDPPSGENRRGSMSSIVSDSTSSTSTLSGYSPFVRSSSMTSLPSASRKSHKKSLLSFLTKDKKNASSSTFFTADI